MTRRDWWIVYALVLGLVATVYSAGVSALLDPAVPLFGDLGGHIVPLRETIRSLHHDGSVRGWSFAWFGGFPRYYFYFPLPALAVAGATPLLGLGRAITLIVIAGPILIPVAAASLARATGGTRSGALLVATGSGVFLVARSLDIAGGTVTSAIIGEFSYALAMALGLFYLASLPHLFRKRTVDALLAPSLLLAATALTHVLPTAVVVVGSVALLQERRQFPLLVATWALAFLLSAWWSVPFLAYSGEMGSLRWAQIDDSRLLVLLVEGAPVAVLAALAFVWKPAVLGRGFYRLAGLLVGVSVIPLFIPASPFYPARLLPFGLWAAHAVAAVSAQAVLRAIRDRRSLIPAAAGLVALGIVIGTAPLRQPPHTASQIVLRGDRMAGDRGQWASLVATLRRLPPGAVINVSRFGKGDAFGPAFAAPGRRGNRTIAGYLWPPYSSVVYGRNPAEMRRSSCARADILGGDTESMLRVLEPPEPNWTLGVMQAKALGARYIVLAADPESRDGAPKVGTREMAKDSLWSLYEIDSAAMAVTADRLNPTQSRKFREAAIEWFAAGAHGAVPVVVSARDLPKGTFSPAVRLPETAVRLRPHEIAIDGAVPGRPLLIRLSFFPNWRLESGGAGPFRAAPNHMLVIPTSEEIRLIWHPSRLEAGAKIASLAVAALFLLLAAAAFLRPAVRAEMPRGDEARRVSW